MLEIIKNGNGYAIAENGVTYAAIVAAEGATDSFEKLEDGAWRWHRHTDAPTDNMRMEIVLLGEATFTMVPAVSYNGNGWGKTPEYVGDRADDGTPWSWASHRVTIPSCTYSENCEISIALMAEPNSNSACSLYKVEEGEKHVLIFPEEEKPKTLHRHFWGEPFQGTMEPTCDFEGVIYASVSDGSKHRYKGLLDFAWRYYGHAIKPPFSAKELYRLSIAYARYLLQKEKDGFIGFTSGAQWLPKLNGYQKSEHGYELGWVGQNASFATAFINDYIENGDKENLEIGLGVLDGWLTKGVVNNRFINAHKRYNTEPNPLLDLPFETMTKEDLDPWEFPESLLEGIICRRLGKPRPATPAKPLPPGSDACNLGTGAEGYFEAYDLLKKIGIDRPEYLEWALKTCDFALESQDENGCFAKNWDYEGNVRSKKGTIGCFLILPLINASKRTGDGKYLDAAKRAFDFYYEELEREGYTTAGALDTYSIDKESASPLLRDSLALYEATGDKKYVEYSEKIAWYLCTWMMHFTVDYPEDCLIAKLNYDTFGATSVSTPHNALDQYALRDVLSFIKLYEITGNIQWRERALAFWCNACQGISDGTLYINGRLRPAGSQDEAIFHTRWGRHTVPPFTPSQWLASWPCAFRLENLRWLKDWSFFDEGLQHIEGALR
ncbi:MAG: hypothetical protein E7619_02655 [Ruminococcaceae bacterium]|nr:hypothetical protein [Oscillospiraceae bacterium]